MTRRLVKGQQNLVSVDRCKVVATAELWLAFWAHYLLHAWCNHTGAAGSFKLNCCHHVKDSDRLGINEMRNQLPVSTTSGTRSFRKLISLNSWFFLLVSRENRGTFQDCTWIQMQFRWNVSYLENSYNVLVLVLLNFCTSFQLFCSLFQGQFGWCILFRSYF